MRLLAACGGRLASHGDCWETIALVRATVASVRLPVLVVKRSSAGSMLASSPPAMVSQMTTGCDTPDLKQYQQYCILVINKAGSARHPHDLDGRLENDHEGVRLHRRQIRC